MIIVNSVKELNDKVSEIIFSNENNKKISFIIPSLIGKSLCAHLKLLSTESNPLVERGNEESSD